MWIYFPYSCFIWFVFVWARMCICQFHSWLWIGYKCISVSMSSNLNNITCTHCQTWMWWWLYIFISVLVVCVFFFSCAASVRMNSLEQRNPLTHRHTYSNEYSHSQALACTINALALLVCTDELNDMEIRIKVSCNCVDI